MSMFSLTLVVFFRPSNKDPRPPLPLLAVLVGELANNAGKASDFYFIKGCGNADNDGCYMSTILMLCFWPGWMSVSWLTMLPTALVLRPLCFILA